MGDRCTVILTVLQSQKDQALALLATKQYVPVSDDEFSNDRVDLEFNEVNYGILEPLADLRANGIAYNSYNGRGDNYSEDTEYCRFTEDGKMVSFCASQYPDHIDIDLLMSMIHHNDTLVDFIKNCDQVRKPLSWANQEAYGKLYMARQLIQPTE